MIHYAFFALVASASVEFGSQAVSAFRTSTRERNIPTTRPLSDQEDQSVCDNTNSLAAQPLEAAVPPNHFSPSLANLNSTVPGFLQGSSLIYGYAKLRKIVRGHDSRLRNGVPKPKDRLLGVFPRGVKPLVNFSRPELIVTQDGTQNRSRVLQYDVTAQAILLFLQSNRHLLNEDKDGDLIFDNQTPIEDRPKMLSYEAHLEKLIDCQLDARIVEFDDQFSNEELVYGITSENTNKRITVFFRGSVLGGKDWATNVQAIYNELPLTGVLKGFKPVKVHRGFYGYLHAPSPQTNETTKFDTIVRNLKDVLKEYPGYDLFISGHSLGGALCQLLAFELACRDDTPSTIRAISFASPQVGNQDYAEAFAALERAGRLRHLRVTNQGDVVPELPFGFGYTQTGVNLHVRNDQVAVVGYSVVKNVFSQARLNSVNMHSLDVYSDRLFDDSNTDLLSKTIDEFYKETAGITFPMHTQVLEQSAS